MDFEENEIVKVITTPTSPIPPLYEHLDQRIGYIDSIPVRKTSELRQHYLVNILSQDGVECTILISQAYLAPDSSEEGKRMYDKHQNNLEEIAHSYIEHHRKHRVVINHLAVKYGVSPDEIRAIYKAVLSFDDYYKEHNL